MSDYPSAHIKPGQIHALDGTANSRRLVAGISAANGDPSAATDGLDITGAREVMVTCTVGTNAVSVLLWTYDANSELWVADTAYGTQNLATGNHRFWLQCPGAQRIYVEATSMGAAGTLSAWASAIHY
jgi:hypothetical protein